MEHIILFASGTGSNIMAILDYFQAKNDLSFSIICNNAEAGIVQKAKQREVPLKLFERKNFTSDTQPLEAYLAEQNPSLMVLAGFLQKIPTSITSAYAGKILNIHPSLLPKYGGKGMYGMEVHRAVAKAKERVSGITIHEVNEVYDEGKILFQEKVAISPQDAPEKIAAKVLELEHFH